MEDVEKTRRDVMHNTLLDMGMCPELSKEAALEIGVGSIEIGVRFCTEAVTCARVRREAKLVVPKTGLRSPRFPFGESSSARSTRPRDLRTP
jgi:hypothetical protein